MKVCCSIFIFIFSPRVSVFKDCLPRYFLYAIVRTDSIFPPELSCSGVSLTTMMGWSAGTTIRRGAKKARGQVPEKLPNSSGSLSPQRRTQLN